SSSPNTSFVFPDNLSNGYWKYVGDAVSHEVGHSLGLQHQSQYSSTGAKLAEYYAGPGDGTAPIMGHGYSAPLSRWWYGTSSLGSTIMQNDMAVIANGTNGFGYRADDYGSTVATASPLAVSGNQLSAAGVSPSPSDVDYFSCTTVAGQISLSVSVPTGFNDLDAALDLRDASGTLL